MGSSGAKRRKPRQRLPPAPKYVRAPRGTRHIGAASRRHEAEARRARHRKPVSRLGRAVLRILGYRGRLRDRRVP